MEHHIRIAKFLAQAGVASRRASEELVRQGRVKVNGLSVESLALQVDPEKDRVELDGNTLSLRHPVSTGMLNKPAGYVTTCNDPQRRNTVMELLPACFREARLVPVGRLDAPTEGLLLFTNDGQLAYRLMHPRYEVEKVYVAWVEGKIGREAIGQLRHGVPLDDGTTRPAEVRTLTTDPEESLLEIRIHEGRKRQVRRMCIAVGHKVRRLQRTKVGPVSLGNLPVGGWRLLNREELEELRKACGLAPSDEEYS